MRQVRSFCVLAIIIAIAFAYPLLRQSFTKTFVDGILDWGVDGWSGPFLRTLVFATASSAILVVSSFLLSLAISGRRLVAPALYTVTLIPALLGSVCIAFAVKLAIMHSEWLRSLIAVRQPVATWTAMLLSQFLQWGPLFSYLFLLRLISVPDGLLGFARVSEMTGVERVRDIYWPHCRNLAAILSLFALVLGLQEFSKFYLILKASAGTGMELASHRLLRYYSNAAPFDPVFAGEHMLSMSAIFVLLALSTVSIVVLFILKAVDLGVAISAKASFRRTLIPFKALRWFAVGMLLLGSAFPLALMCVYLFPVHLPSAGIFWNSLVFTLFAATLVSGLSIAFAAGMRVAFKERLKRFDTKSLPAFVALSLILVVPPIAIAFCGFYWISLLGEGLRSTWLVLSVWLLGQVILAFPLVACFILSTHFAVTTSEIDFQTVAKATITEAATFSFWRRFRAEYVLTALFGFSIIWNEATLSSVVSGLSHNVPSLAVRLLERVDGRASSYNEAANLVLLTFIPVLIAVVLWSQIYPKYFRAK